MKRKFAGDVPKCLVEMWNRCEYANKAVKSIASMDVIEVYDQNGKCSVLVYKNIEDGSLMILTGQVYRETLESLVRCIMDVGYGLDQSPEELIAYSREFFWMGVQNSASCKKIDPNGLVAAELFTVFNDIGKDIWDSFNKDFADEVLELVQSKITEGNENGKDAKKHP